MPISIQILLTLLVITAAAYDLRFRRIPNWVVVSGLVLGIGLSSFLFEWNGLRFALFGIGVAFLVYFPLYLLRGMGAGDVKLMMAIGAIAGPKNWLGIFIATGILGGLIAMMLLAKSGTVGKTLINVAALIQSLLRFEAPYKANAELDVRSSHSVKMAHGAVIAIGTIFFLAFMGWTRQL